MAVDSQRVPQQEPVGIVISLGDRPAAVPAFRGYIWGPAPEKESTPAEPKAA